MGLIDVYDVAVAELNKSAASIAKEFVRRRVIDTGNQSADGIHNGDELSFARRVVELCAASLTGAGIIEEVALGFEEQGARAAARGRSAAGTIDWLRGLESAVKDHVLASSILDLGALRQGIARIDKLFDELCSRQLDTYTTTYDELAGWYSRVGTDLVSYLVSGAPIEASVVNRHARALNVDPHQPFRAVAVQHGNSCNPSQWAGARRRLASLFRQHDPKQSVLVHERNGLLLALVPASQNDSSLVDRLNRFLDDAELKRTLYISTGEAVDSLPFAGRSCRQALSALEIANYRGYRGQVTQCTEVILEVLLTHNHWVSNRIIVSRLSGIVEKPHLIDTLRAYIDCDMSLQRTAEELFIHPNTVAYRLRQIAALTGRDMRRIVDLTELTVALTALDVIKMRHDQEKGRTDLRALLLTDQ